MAQNTLNINEGFDVEQKRISVNLSDLQFQADDCAMTFYEQYRNLIMARMKKKGDIIKWQNNRVLSEDEELSPTFEELILDRVLGLIDTRLPGYVWSHFIEQSESLMDYKNDILNKVPTFLEEMKYIFPAIVISEEDQQSR
jgi:hypothetical protein